MTSKDGIVMWVVNLRKLEQIDFPCKQFFKRTKNKDGEFVLVEEKPDGQKLEYRHWEIKKEEKPIHVFNDFINDNRDALEHAVMIHYKNKILRIFGSSG